MQPIWPRNPKKKMEVPSHIVSPEMLHHDHRNRTPLSNNWIKCFSPWIKNTSGTSGHEECRSLKLSKTLIAFAASLMLSECSSFPHQHVPLNATLLDIWPPVSDLHDVYKGSKKALTCTAPSKLDGSSLEFSSWRKEKSYVLNAGVEAHSHKPEKSNVCAVISSFWVTQPHLLQWLHTYILKISDLNVIGKAENGGIITITKLNYDLSWSFDTFTDILGCSLFSTADVARGRVQLLRH